MTTSALGNGAAASDGLVDVAQRLRRTAERCGDHPAILWQGTTITYRELNDKVDAAVGALQHLGVGTGDRVALVLGNTPAFVEAWFGVLRSGATAVPVNIGTTADELGHVLRNSGARVIIVAASALDAVMAQLRDVNEVQHIVVTGTDAAPEGTSGTWSSLLAAKHERRPVARDLDDVAALVYTSGTTGRPRGAMLTRGNLAANVDQSLAGRFRIEETDTVLLVLPLFHIFALNVGLGSAVRVGATMVLQERFDTALSLEAIAEHQVSILLGAPPMYIAWLQAAELGGVDLSSVRIAVSGAAALPRYVFDRFRDHFGLTIWEGYGLTEASPSVTSNAMTDEARAGSVGLPLPEIEIRLLNKSGEEVRVGDPGELLIRGPNVFAGYWADPAATSAALDGDGWLRTGDVATQDEEGYLYLVDRVKDLIIVSGFNVYPREVERVLLRHADVAEAAVVGRPHPYTGETVRAFVVLRPGAEVTMDALHDHCSAYLARYKCPQGISFVDTLPQTATGKVRRGELREQAITGAD